MRKLLLLVAFMAMSFVGFSSIPAHASGCQSVSFSDATVCVSIEKTSNSYYRVRRTISNAGSNALALTCDILTPDNVLRNVGSCDESFSYSDRDIGTVVIYMQLNGQNRTISERYDFRDGEWTNSNNNYYDDYDDCGYWNNYCDDYYYDDNDDCYYYNDCYNNGDLDNFYLTTDDSTPAVNQRVDLTIKARDDDNYTLTDYRGTVRFRVYYRSSSSSSWVQTTSSTYYEVSSNYDDYGYDFDSYDDGVADLNNFIRFKKNNYDYKIRVYDEDDSFIYKEITFDVGSSSNNNNCYYYNDCYGNDDLDNFYLTTDDSTPSINQRVDLTVRARDNDNYTLTDYNGSIDYRVYYRSSNSSSWIETTSSTYYEVNYSYDNGYDFDSYDDGVADLNNFIRFKKNYDYKVRIYDKDDIYTYKEITFDVGSSSNNNDDCYYYNDCYNNGDLDNFYLTTDDSTPAVNQRVDLTIRARDNDNYTLTDYRGTVRFRVYYRSSSSSSWVQTTSSTYYEVSSNYDDYGYDFDSYDDGVADLNNFIRFKKNNYDYKIRVYDEDDSFIYKEITFDVGSSSNNNNCYYYNDCYDSNNNGFTSSQINQIENIYNLRPSLISSMENDYPRLRNNQTRQLQEADLYTQMYNITRDRISIYDNYDEFFDAFRSRYIYTLQVR